MSHEKVTHQNGVGDIFRDFFETSSITGAAHLVHKSRPRRIFWCFLIFGMFIGFSLNALPACLKYLTYPTVTESRIKPRAFRFPDVTICPENPLESQISANISHLKQIWQTILVKRMGLETETADELASTKAIQANRGYTKPNEEKLFKMGNKKVSCSYRGRPCILHDIRPPNEYGCLRISPEKRDVVNSNGKIGLLLSLKYSPGIPFLKEDQMETMSPSYKLIAHAANTAPDFDQSAAIVVLQRGKINQLKVTMKEQNDVSTTNRPCESVEERAIGYWTNDLSEQVNFLMNKQMCKDFVFQRKLFEECGCYDDTKWVPTTKPPLKLCSRLPPNVYYGEAFVGSNDVYYSQKMSKNIPFEDSDIAENLLSRSLCLKNFTMKNPPHDLPRCLNRSCNETFYEVQSTFRDPRDLTRSVEIAQKYELQKDADYIIQLSAANTEVVEYYERLSYDYNDLLSDIGGQVAVWISCSMITLFELVELILRLIGHCLKKCCCCCCNRGRGDNDAEEGASINLEEKS